MDQKLDESVHRVYGLCVLALNEDNPRILKALCKAMLLDVRQLFFRKLVSARTCEAITSSAGGKLDPELKSRIVLLAEMCLWLEIDEHDEIIELIEQLCPSRLGLRLAASN